MSELDRLRAAVPWAKSMSDGELLGELQRRTGKPITDIAADFGIQGGGKWTERGSAAIDSAQANLYGIGEAAGLGDWAVRGRKRNEAEAGLSREFARQKGAVMSYKDAEGVGGWADYIGGLAVDSGPQLVAMGAAGLAGGPLAAGAVGYGFAVGDVLDSQRDQAGKTDLPTALGLAVPYAAVDTLTGVGGRVVSRTLPRAAGVAALDKGLDAVKGVKGAAARGGAAALRTGVVEGAGETFQEGMNQLGRMAVDPNEQFLSDAAQERFAESFIGGGALGGAFGGATGWRRSKGYQGPQVNPSGKTDLLSNPPADTPNALDQAESIYRPAVSSPEAIEGQLGLRFPLNPREAALRQEEIAGAFAEPLNQFAVQADGTEARLDAGQYAALQADSRRPAPPAPSAPTLGDMVAPFESISQPAMSSPEAIEAQLGLRFPAGPNEVRQRAADVAAAALEPTNQFGVRSDSTEVRLDAGQDSAMRAGDEVDTSQVAAVEARAQEILARDGRAQRYGLKGTAAMDTFSQLEDALNDGTINQAQFNENVALIKANRHGQVRKFLKAYPEQKARAAQSDAEAIAEVYARLKGKAAKNVPAPTQSGTEAGTTPPAQGSAQVAGVAADKTITVGRSDRKVSVTPGQLLNKIKAASPLDKLRILAATGLESTEDPTTGKATLVPSRAPMSLDEIAAEESRVTGKKVSRQAISQALAKFGLDENAITAFVAGEAPGAVTEADLGIDQDAEASGFRVEDSVSKAAGQGALAGDAPTKQEARLKRVGDYLLKRAERKPAAPAESDAEPNLREQNPEIIQQNIRMALGTLFAQKAALYWDGSVGWFDLPDTLKADWVDEMHAIEAREGSLEGATEAAMGAAERRIEEDYAEYTRNNAKAARSIGSGDAGKPAPAQDAPRVAGPDAETGTDSTTAGTGSYVGDAGSRVEAAKPVVVTKKKRAVEKPANAPLRPAGEDAASTREMALRQKSRADEQPGDVMLGSGRFVSLEDAAAAANEAIAAGELARAPFQFNRVLDIAARDWDRMMAATEPKFSKAEDRQGSTVARVMTEISKLRLGLDPKKVIVVQSQSELPAFIQASLEDVRPQGFVLGGRAFLIADNIRPGNARSVFMHEVGAHMGIENLLSAKEFGRLANKVVEWADRKDGSIESELARKAIKRTGAAGTPAHQLHYEVVAYFIEEATRAGIDPTALQYKTDIGRWMAEVVRLIKAALKKLGLVNAEGLTAQDVVDLAYGAAQLEMQVDNRGEMQKSVEPQFSIADEMPAKLQKPYSAVGQVLSDIKTKSVLLGAFTEDLVRAASRVIPAAAQYLNVMKEAQVVKTRLERNVELILEGYRTLPAHERGTGPGGVNALLKAATMEKKWPFKPEYHDGVTVDAEMAGRFNGMSAAAQKLIRDVFKHGHDSLQELRTALLEDVTSEYDLEIAEAKRTGQDTTELEAKKLQSLKEISSLAQFQGNWPYAPLKRFGNEVVVGMSQQYMDAKRAGDQAKMRELESDEKHYYVAFFDTRGQARAQADKLKAQGLFPADGVQNFNKDSGMEQLYGGRDTLHAFRRLRGLVEDMDSADAKRLNGLMKDLHLTLLSESSARQSERNRRNVAGADDDMMEAFATQGRAHAHFVGSLKSGGKVTDALYAMKKEADALDSDAAGGTREERRDYFNELMKRHVTGLDYRPTPFIDKAMRASSIWMLLTSPAYHFMNFTQPMLMSAPVLGAMRGVGLGRAYSTMAKAYREVLPLLKDGRVAGGDYAGLPEDVRDMVQKLADRGVIQISLEQELGSWKSTEDNAAKRVFGTVVRKMDGVSQGIETINRMVTAISAIRLARQNGLDEAGQLAQAAKVIYDTHGDYSAFNAPRVMRSGVGRLLTQFRKFQLIQISLYARLAKDAFGDASPEEKLVARKALAFSLGNLMLVGGALGLPGAKAIGIILGAVFGDDDEPDDPEMTLRRAIGNDAVSDLLLKGVPAFAGVDLSGRLGAGGMLSLLPRAEGSLASREGMQSHIQAALGPFFGGLLPQFADGVGTIYGGDYAKGLEKLLPRGLADVVKATRLGTEGMTQKNGDTVMSADELGFLDLTFQAIGLPTTTLSERGLRASSKFKADKFYDERTTSLKREYIEAYRENDVAGMQAARDEWMQVQAARVRLGYKRQPLTDLIRAPQNQTKRERNTVGGVQFRDGDRRAAEMLDEQT